METVACTQTSKRKTSRQGRPIATTEKYQNRQRMEGIKQRYELHQREISPRFETKSSNKSKTRLIMPIDREKLRQELEASKAHLQKRGKGKIMLWLVNKLERKGLI